MRTYRFRIVLLALLAAAALSACAGPSTAAPTAELTPLATGPAATEAPLPEPTATTPAGPSFEAETYRDETSGFEFDHPAGWFVGPVEQQSRGGITAFTSWERPTDVLPGETPEGETRLDVTVQLWDPQNDLEAFVEQRLLAWDASGIAVPSDETWSLSDGRAARAFLVVGPDGAPAFFFFTTVGENYLVLSGSGNVDLLAEIAHTVRPLTTP